jgi:hypothetical protein
MFERLLLALDRLAEAAEGTGDESVREWSTLAQLDAIDLGEELGMLFDTEAAERREVVRSRVADIDQAQPD